MTLPSTVTSRVQGNAYIGKTGMLMSVQTGFALRTGFYLTNSGNSTVEMSLENKGFNYDAYDFLSGQNEPVIIPAGSTKFIGFDFYGLKDSSGPNLVYSGPLGMGPYTTTVDLTFRSQQDNSLDQTFYAGVTPSGVIRLLLTGYVTGNLNKSGELTPSHPSGFLVQSGLYSGNGKPYNILKWEHPSTGYYYEEVEIEYSNDTTASWNDLIKLDITKTEFVSDVDNVSINAYYYGTPTGLANAKTYEHTSLSFNSSYYYRLRGNHYAFGNDVTPTTSSEWVYGYPVLEFEDTVPNDVLTGLVSGSSTLPTGGNPYGVINCDAGNRQAIKIYLENGETNVNLNTKFSEELTSRGLDNTYFDSSTGNYSFTGVHFILPENYIVGSTDSSKAAIETGDVLEDSSSNEIKSLLILKSNSFVLGRGGDGGNGGYAEITDLGLFTVSFNRYPLPQLQFEEKIASSNGSNGTSAIKITDTNIANFQIWADIDAKIYGGGGGGGGGDSTFYSQVILDFINNKQPLSNKKVFIDSKEAYVFGTISEIQAGSSFSNLEIQNLLSRYSNLNVLSKQDVVGNTYAGVGGGGQGYISYGGKAKGFGDKIYENSNGSLKGLGLGSRPDLSKRVSAGGNGGEFGQDGQKPPETVFENRSLNDPSSYSGGIAGYAIDASSNSNYTVSNFRSNLFFISKKVQIEGIKGFLAHWDAEDTSNLFSDYSTATLVSNGSNVDRWYPKNKNSSISTYLLGGARKPVYYSSNSYFNNKACVVFDGVLKTMSFQDIVGDSPRLRNEMSGFEIFYNLLSFDPVGIGQFDSNGNHLKINNILHKWSSIGNDNQFSSYFYNKNGKIVENTGIGEKNISFTDLNYKNGILFKPSSSFVYNISVKEIAKDVLEYKVFYNKKLMFSQVFRNSFISFISNPIIGSFGTGDNMSFAISDIVIYNRKVNETERNSVNSVLANKNRIIKTNAGTPSYTDQNKNVNRNLLSDSNGFAGFIVLNS